MSSNARISLAIWIFFTFFYSLFSLGHFAGDGYSDYLTAESIVLERNVALYDRPGDIDDLKYPREVGRPGRDGKIYSTRGALGMPVILSLFYFVGHIASFSLKYIPHDFITMFFVSFANPLITAFNCLLVFIISSRFKFSLKISTVLAFIYGLATMAPVYVRSGFSEPALSLFILLSIYFGLKYKDSGKLKYLIFAGLTVAYMPFLRPNSFSLLACFVFYLSWVLLDKKAAGDRISHFLIFAVSLTIPLVILFLSNLYLYGGLLKFGGLEAVSVTERIASSPHFLKGLYYYLFSPGKGFFIFNLPIILAFFGIRWVPKERRKEAFLFMFIFLANLLFFAKSFRRGSLFSWGPRYLFPSVTVLVFLIGDFFERYRGMLARAFSICLSLTGFIIILPCLFINQPKYYYFVKEQLKLDEYMVNFIPDLSPISAAWKMFISRVILETKGVSVPFIYNPDYRLVKPISAYMDGYNNFDSWLMKIKIYSPAHIKTALAVAILMAAIALFSLYKIVKTLNRGNGE